MPRRWHQVGGIIFADDGGKQARSPGRARRKPLKPLRGECRAFSGVTVVTNLRVFYFYTQGCGRIGRPAFPAPSDGRGQTISGQLGRDASREGAVCLYPTLSSLRTQGPIRCVARVERCCQSAGAQQRRLVVMGPCVRRNDSEVAV